MKEGRGRRIQRGRKKEEARPNIRGKKQRK